MPEQLEKLRATLQDLEAELEGLDTVDAETRDLLEEALLEIAAKIQDPRRPDGEDELLSNRLAGAAERFETSHPTLFGLVTRLADALAQMGI